MWAFALIYPRGLETVQLQLLLCRENRPSTGAHPDRRSPHRKPSAPRQPFRIFSGSRAPARRDKPAGSFTTVSFVPNILGQFPSNLSDRGWH